MTATSPKDVLIAARKLIEKPENWCQRQFQNHLGARCAMGAICGAIADDYYENEEIAAKAAAILGDVVDTAVISFNDAPGRTHEEVLRAFDKAIEAA